MALCFIRACFESEYRLRGSTTKILLNGKGFSKKEKPCKIARIFVGFDTQSVWLFENSLIHPSRQTKKHISRCAFLLVERGGFEPPKSLTTDLQSAPFGHSGTSPYGAGDRNRTNNLLITNQLLCLLSYTSVLSCWCLGADSNHRHRDFQSLALPPELPRHTGFQSPF